jgi:hypothetical protein
MKIYGHAIAHMTIWGGFAGIVFGGLYGFSITGHFIGLIFGLLNGGSVGMALGIPCGLIVGFITQYHLYRLDDPQDYRYSLSIGIAVFVLVGAGIAFFSMYGINLFTAIPTVSASVCAGYAAKSFADQYVDSKRENHV